MRTLIPLVAAVLSLARPCSGGTITGSVHAEGKAGADNDALCGKYDSREFKFVDRVKYSDMHDFVVYIDGLVETNAALLQHPAQVVTRKISQKGAMFSPHVLPVLVGTTVEWPNNDDILHNVFSFSEPKPFDLGLYKSPEVKRVTFEKPGRVDVYCSIHTRMSCVVLVLQNPYFAVTSERGVYTIRDVPPGTYKVKAWHERLPCQVQEVVVPETGQVKADFTLGIKNLPTP
jgi:plastocyanin